MKVDQFQGTMEVGWNSFWNLKKGKSPMKISQFFNFKMDKSPEKIDQFQENMKACWNYFLNLKKGRSSMKIDQFFNFKRDGLPVIIKPFSFKKQNLCNSKMGESPNNSDRHFVSQVHYAKSWWDFVSWPL
jgi:hypothetical protein